MTTYNKFASYWTVGAIDCYRRGCKCEGCLIFQLYGRKCRMREAVFELVRKFGAPPDKQGFTKTQRKIIDAILMGANTRKEIAKMINSKEEQVQSVLPELYKYAEANGDIFSNPRKKLNDFIEWVRENISDEQSTCIL